LKILLWEVFLRQAPTTTRFCKRCDKKTEFESSGLFRVNAQQKNLDVWLIYKCHICEATWNLTVLTRVGQKSVSGGLMERYSNNDSDLAMIHVTDYSLIKRNGAQLNIADAYITGKDYRWDEPVEINLTTKHPIENKATSLIRQKLAISGNKFNELCNANRIISFSGHNLKKCKMKDKIILCLKP
jgi:hypothetical protein